MVLCTWWPLEGCLDIVQSQGGVTAAEGTGSVCLPVSGEGMLWALGCVELCNVAWIHHQPPRVHRSVPGT